MIRIQSATLIPGTYFCFVDDKFVIRELFLDEGQGLERARLDFPSLYSTVFVEDTLGRINPLNIRPYSPQSVTVFSGPYILISQSFDDRNLYHWLFLALQKVWMVENEMDLQQYKLLITYEPSSMQLELLNIFFPHLIKYFVVYSPSKEEAQIRGVERVAIQIPELISGFFLPSDFRYLTFLRNRLSQYAHQQQIERQPNSSEFVYVTRGDGGNRNRELYNRDEIEEVFTKHGFAVVRMSELPIKSQISVTRGARIFAFEHGAAGSWITALRPNSIVLELISPLNSPTSREIATHYRSLTANFQDLTYYQILGAIEQVSLTSEVKFTISPQVLNEIIPDLKLMIKRSKDDR